MSEKVTIEIPDEVSHRARTLAVAVNRRFEDAEIDWISRAASEPDVQALSDDELLKLCDATFEASEQAELSGLLADAREGVLNAAGSKRLDDLMATYRRGLVLKARAWKEAVSRDLRTLPTDTLASVNHAS